MSGVRFYFTDARVLVTGGTSGIGYEIASQFVQAGAEVMITGTRPTVHDYERDLSAFSYGQLRLEDRSMVDALAEGIPKLDILVNNAGANMPGGRDEWDLDTFEASLALNLTGAFRLANRLQPTLEASLLSGGASVVNMASMASYFGLTIVPGYGAAKAGIVQTTKTLAVKWADTGIRVNAVAPGLIDTEMTSMMKPYEDIWKPMIDRTPMARWGEPSDIAPVVLFLCSAGAKFITGQTIAVDGGYSIA